MEKNYTGQEWSENRWPRFQFGLILALIFVNFAFNYEGQRPIYLPLEIDEDHEFIEQSKQIQVNEPPLMKQIQTSSELHPEPLDLPLQDLDYKKVSMDITSDQKSISEQDSYFFEEADRMEIPPEEQISVEEIKSNEPLKFAEKMPLYKSCIEGNEVYEQQLDCTMKEIMKIIRQKLKYPAVARENGIQGTVIGSFVVNKLGQITEIKVERTSAYGLAEAVIDVFTHIPDFIPAEQNKEKVSVKMHIPVKFKIAE